MSRPQVLFCRPMDITGCKFGNRYVCIYMCIFLLFGLTFTVDTTKMAFFQLLCNNNKKKGSTFGYSKEKISKES